MTYKDIAVQLLKLGIVQAVRAGATLVRSVVTCADFPDFLFFHFSIVHSHLASFFL